jgi:hypothetical protein
MLFSGGGGNGDGYRDVAQQGRSVVIWVGGGSSGGSVPTKRAEQSIVEKGTIIDVDDGEGRR